MKWEDVLKRDDIVGGDIETRSDYHVFRGPLAKVEIKDGMVFFEMSWMAELHEGERWKKTTTTSFFVSAKDCPPIQNGCDSILFNIPFLGFGAIFLKGGSKLDLSQVEGLE